MNSFYKFILSFLLVAGGAGLSSCNKNFLDRTPEANLTAENFFKNTSDLQTYANTFYSFLPGYSIALNDAQSDNYEVNPFNKVVAGQVTIPTTWNQSVSWVVNAGNASWDWTFLTQVNYFLQNYQQATAPAADKNHYAGVARFFRAWFYFEKVKQYGDVPWYNTALQPNDSADLYKARDPRALVMDSVLADLRFAVANIYPTTSISGTITQPAALALMARICLHEGTYREYHGLDGGQPFLQLADSAAQAIISGSAYSLYSTGKPTQDYGNLFITYTPSDPQNKEIILARYYSNSLHVTTPLDGDMDAYGLSVTKDLMNTYLTSAGTPFTAVPGFDTMMIRSEFSNRDPRMAQTVLAPTASLGTLVGWDVWGAAPTGYQQIKYYDPATPSYNTNYNAALIFRYAEILLIHAEARAELGTLTQADLDASINLIRARVGMPPLSMSVALDPVLAAEYPNVSGTLQNVLLEIRRERRVELACEGLRYDDLMRWKAGPLLAKPFTGMYFPGLGAYDLNGDGQIDYDLVASLPANPTAGVTYRVLGTDFFLTNGSSGNVIPYPNLVKTFTDPQNYLFPLPATELLLNSNLTQNPGW
jgi:hypothetical protein